MTNEFFVMTSLKEEILDEHIAKKLVWRRAYGSKHPATGRTLQAPAVWHFVEIIQITFQRRAAVGHRQTLHDSAPTEPDRALNARRKITLDVASEKQFN
jgi:hypothetical protein